MRESEVTCKIPFYLKEQPQNSSVLTEWDHDGCNSVNSSFKCIRLQVKGLFFPSAWIQGFTCPYHAWWQVLSLPSHLTSLHVTVCTGSREFGPTKTRGTEAGASLPSVDVTHLFNVKMSFKLNPLPNAFCIFRGVPSFRLRLFFF